MTRELESDPDNLYLMIELANCLGDLCDPKTIELRQQIVRKLRPLDEDPPTVAVVYTLDRLITYPAETAEAGLTFNDVRFMCQRWFPCSAPLRWAVAQRLFTEQDFQGAAVQLAEVIRLVETDELDKLVPFDPRVRHDAEFNLAVCLTRLARLDEAETFFRRFLQSPNRANAARANLEVIANLRKLQDD
jgi:hypothetical protein